ncbi:phosphotransferase [Kutzneria viridogrisea]|uniref:phosphotransferase n=1 Tax=Kutzneria viridogrisea TaxID=47990 RepID=UPI0016014684
MATNYAGFRQSRFGPSRVHHCAAVRRPGRRTAHGPWCAAGHAGQVDQAAIAASDGLIDIAAVTAVWQDALRIPAWSGQPAWTHADLSPGNLLVRDGRLTAVIDWDIAGVGDSTVDLIVAWNLLPASARRAFREALAVDDDAWHRGRGWALSISLIQLPYYQNTNPALAANSRHVIAEILADAG